MEKDPVRASILLVDDEYAIRKSLTKELRTERFAVTEVASGIEAISALRQLQFNIVITDLMMEGIDGFGVLRAVKELAPLTRVIVITGYGDLRTAIDAMHLGADDFLVKPFEVEELIFRIRRCLEKRNLIEMLMVKTQQLEKEIQRRSRIEERLIENENRFRLALDSASNGVWDRNLSTGENFHGANWCRTLGYAPEETPVFEEILHPDDRERVFKLGEEHISGQTPLFEAELRLRNKAGEWHWVLSRGKVVEWDEQGRAVRIVGTITDINRLKQEEARLRSGQEELQKTVQAQSEEVQAARQVLRRLQGEVDEARQVLARISARLLQFYQELDNSGLTEQQRRVLQALREDLDPIR